MQQRVGIILQVRIRSRLAILIYSYATLHVQVEVLPIIQTTQTKRLFGVFYLHQLVAILNVSIVSFRAGRFSLIIRDWRKLYLQSNIWIYQLTSQSTIMPTSFQIWIFCTNVTGWQPPFWMTYKTFMSKRVKEKKIIIFSQSQAWLMSTAEIYLGF